MPVKSFNFFTRDKGNKLLSPSIYGYFDFKSFDFENSGVDFPKKNQISSFSDVKQYYVNDASGTALYYSLTGEAIVSTNIIENDMPSFWGQPSTGDAKELINLYNSGLLSGDLSGKFYQLLSQNKIDTFIFDNIDNNGNINKIYIYNTEKNLENFSIKLFPPQDIAISNVAANSFAINWPNVSGATNYRIDVSTNYDFKNFISGYANNLVNGTGIIVSGLNPGSIYFVGIRSENENDVLLSYTSVTATETITRSPEQLEALNVQEDSFSLKWDSVFGAIAYHLDIATDSNFTNFVNGYQNKIIYKNNCTIFGLNSGTIYYIRIRAINSSYLNSLNSETLIVSTLIDTPTGLTSSNITANSFNLSWDAVPGATSYRIDVARDISFTIFVDDYNNKLVNGTAYTFSNLNSEKNYYVRVRAVNATLASNNSNVIAITTLDNVLSNRPNLPYVSNLSANSFNISWDPIVDAVSYRIDVSVDSLFKGFLLGYYNKIITGTGTTISGTIQGFTYYLRIRAINNNGAAGPFSQVLMVSTPLAAPSGLRISNIKSNYLDISWNSVKNATYYSLDVATNSSFTNFVNGYQGKKVYENNDAVENLNGGTTYYFRVRAINSQELPSLNSITITRTTLPNSLTAPPSVSNITANSFNLSWDAVPGATSYRIDVATDNSFTNLVQQYRNKNITETYTSVTGLNSLSVYYVRVRAVIDNIASDSSPVLKVSTINVSSFNPVVINTPTTSYNLNTTQSTNQLQFGHVDNRILSSESVSWLSPTVGTNKFNYSGVKHWLPYGSIKNSIIRHATSGFLANNTVVLGWDNVAFYSTAAISVKERFDIYAPIETGIDPVTGPIIVDIDIEHQNHNDLLIALRAPSLKPGLGGFNRGTQKILKFPIQDYGRGSFAVAEAPCQTCWGPHKEWPHMVAYGNPERLSYPSSWANSNIYIDDCYGNISGNIEFWGEIDIYSPIQAFTPNPNTVQAPYGQDIYIKPSYVDGNKNVTMLNKPGGGQFLGNRTGEYVPWAEMRMYPGFSGAIFNNVRDLCSYFKFGLKDPSQQKYVSILNFHKLQDLKNHPNIIVTSGFRNISNAPGGQAWFENIKFSGYKVSGFEGSSIMGSYFAYARTSIVGSWLFLLENSGFAAARLRPWPLNYTDLRFNGQPLIQPYVGLERLNDSVPGVRYAPQIAGSFRMRYSGDFGPHPNNAISGRRIYNFILPDEFKGCHLRGKWNLMILDFNPASTGVLHNWSITFNNGIQNRDWLNTKMTVKPYIP